MVIASVSPLSKPRSRRRFGGKLATTEVALGTRVHRVHVRMYTGCSMLSPADREFFARVSEAAFANPFGEERDRIDRNVARAPKGADRAEVLDRLLVRVRSRLRELRASERRRLPEPDRTLVEQAILFDLFHRYMEAFDALIQEQVARGG